MSYAAVWCNGEFVGGWPFGYTSWRVDLTPHLKPGGLNTLAIRLDNPEKSSRWYPGGGIYRNVWLVKTEPVHVAQWGLSVDTSQTTPENPVVGLSLDIDNHGAAGTMIDMVTIGVDGIPPIKGNALPKWQSVHHPRVTIPASGRREVNIEFSMANYKPWSIEHPVAYTLRAGLYSNGKLVDNIAVPFGIRTVEFDARDGFILNGQPVEIKGANLHHDLGALGAAFNTRARERQLEMLKEMGVNAIRTAHNPPAPELLELCDRMGFVVIPETFDTWQARKTRNDYHKLFDDWNEQDTRAMVRRYRNHPSVIMWSIGNEMPDQARDHHGIPTANMEAAHVHKEDMSRPITAGINHSKSGFSGFQHTVDVFGGNYFAIDPVRFIRENPDIPFYFSESAATVSSRGEYFFPFVDEKEAGLADFHVSSYDRFAPRWANLVEVFFKTLDENPRIMGEFVWSGFDYLGEPTPYNSDMTNLLNYSTEEAKAQAAKELEELGKIRVPSRSSYFGVIDLAGFPKDRFYLYQARWRPELPIAHILPHWNWAGREGEITPVHVYTSGDAAELFLNGRSLGRKARGPLEYRLRWDDVRYEPGELKVVAYKNGEPWAQSVTQTTGAARQLLAEADRAQLEADGEDLAFVTVTVADAQGRMVPTADTEVTFTVEGPGELVATDNGDQTSHVPFQSPVREAFNGLCLGIVRTLEGQRGRITVTVSAEGMTPVTVELRSR